MKYQNKCIKTKHGRNEAPPSSERWSGSVDDMTKQRTQDNPNNKKKNTDTEYTFHAARSSKHNFATGRTYSPSLVITMAVLTTPSGPGNGRTTRPSGQWPLGELLVTMMTTSSAVNLSLSDSHFLLSMRWGLYSF